MIANDTLGDAPWAESCRPVWGWWRASCEVLMLNVSTLLRHNGFTGLGILPEDGRPKGPGKDGWSDRGRRKDREGDGGWTWDQVGLTGSTVPLRPSLSFRRPHRLPGWSQRRSPCSPTAERDVDMAKGTTRKRGPAPRDGRWVGQPPTESEA